MAGDKVWGFNEEGFRRVREATRRVLGAPRTGSQQRRQVPVVGGGICPPRNETWGIYLFGPPTSGNLSIPLTIFEVQELITIAWDATSAEAQTAFEGHSEVGSGQVSVSGGDFPNISLVVEFIGDLEHKMIPVPATNFSALSGTGVGAVIVRHERGMPGDAS